MYIVKIIVIREVVMMLNDETRTRRSREKKQSVKHAVFSVDMIDKLIAMEGDPYKLSVLKKLRKEAKKVWQL